MSYTPKLQASIISTLSHKLNYYSYSFFYTHSLTILTTKLNDLFNLVPVLINTINYHFLTCGLTALIALVLLGHIHLFFAVSLLVWIALFFGLAYLRLKKFSPFSYFYNKSKAELWEELSEYITHMLNVKLFATSKYESSRIQKLSLDFIKRAVKQTQFLINFYIIQGLIVISYTAIFSTEIFHLYSKNLITLGDASLVFLLNFTLFKTLYELSHDMEEFVLNIETTNQALKILDRGREIHNPPNAVPLIVKKGTITFEKAAVCYQNVACVLYPTLLKIEAGQKVGLVGYEESSKELFLYLILGLERPSSGRILIDNQDLQTVTHYSVRDSIATIPKDLSLFHRSIKENIRYGSLGATDEEVMEAAKRAHAHEFILKLPQGYNTLGGNLHLTHDQYLRIALARAILREAPILLINEPTFQLDPDRTKSIQKSLKDLMKGRTSIIITHRLSTLHTLDRILVFKDNKIVEDGSPRELKEKGGFYKTLYDNQIGGFFPENPQEF